MEIVRLIFLAVIIAKWRKKLIGNFHCFKMDKLINYNNFYPLNLNNFNICEFPSQSSFVSSYSNGQKIK